MVYTEIKKRNSRRYYYRVLSVRNNDKVNKKRVYLGVNLNKNNLNEKESEADRELNNQRELKSLKKIRYKIIRILKQHNIKKAGIFGSYAEGKQTKKSDIDILIQPPKGMGLEFFGVQIELESKLKKKVDLVTYNGLSPFLRERILKQEVRII
jgi:uncharacterized protein